MSTYTQILYQIVFSTKYREKVLLKPNREKLFKYINGTLKNHNCKPYIINGVSDHLHIITHLHPSCSLAEVIKDIKISSSLFIKKEGLFPDFNKWQIGYGAFTYSNDALKNLIRYVKNQEAHHNEILFIDEYKNILKSQNIEFDEKYLL